MSGNPVLDVFLIAQTLVGAGVPVLGNLALVLLAAIAVRPSGRGGWGWLVAAGCWGMASAIAMPVLHMVLTSFVAARWGSEALIQGSALLSMGGSLGQAGWWVLLLGGLAAMTRE